MHESPALVAVDKPSGWLTVPARTGDADPRPVLGRLLEARFGRLWPVHRLDVEVSGLVVFARHADAHRALGAAFESRAVDKRYEALTEGATEVPRAFRWESRLVRGKRRAFVAAHGKPSLTIARAVARRPAGPCITGAATVLRFELEPHTGRPHQLRVHLRDAGFPIAGDVLYGAATRVAEGAVALRAVRLVLPAELARTFDLPHTFEVAGIDEAFPVSPQSGRGMF